MKHRCVSMIFSIWFKHVFNREWDNTFKHRDNVKDMFRINKRIGRKNEY